MISSVKLFQDPIVSAYVDMFVLKYYGFNSQDYTTYNTLFTSSNVVPETAFFQLLKSKTVGINLCRTIIAKPVSSIDQSYMSASLLSSAFTRAKTDMGWFAGFANLDFQSDSQGLFQQQVLQPLRFECLTKGNCHCY